MNFLKYFDIEDSKITSKEQYISLSGLRIKFIFVLLITLFEFLMILNFIVRTGIGPSDKKLYFFAYCFLLYTSLAAVIFLYIIRKNIYNYYKEIMILTYIYSVIIMLWGMGITALDILSNSGSRFTAITFFSCVTGVACGIIGNPKIMRLLFIFFYFIFNLVCSYLVKKSFFSFSLFVNSTIFFIILIIFSEFQYRTKVKEWHQKLFIRKNMEEMTLLNDKLYQVARTDYLTGLGNRVSLSETFDKLKKHELLKNEISQQSIAILLLDIDDFKNINDTYGHEMGDKVIKDISKILMENFNWAFRYGGEEFIVLYPCNNIDLAIDKANSLREKIRNLKRIGADEVTISVGIFYTPFHSKLSDTYLIDRVDKALYMAKNEGKDCVRVYNTKNNKTNKI